MQANTFCNTRRGIVYAKFKKIGAQLKHIKIRLCVPITFFPDLGNNKFVLFPIHLPCLWNYPAIINPQPGQAGIDE
jgi:hypothetical protein